ncbi:MAG: GGDEF domain-containing protein [Peptococcaceae bacterium]
MDKYMERILKPIFALLDGEGKIRYCNVNNHEVIERLFAEINLRKYLDSGDDLKKEVAGFSVNVEKISFAGKVLWVVTIENEAYLLMYKDLATGLFNRNYWEHIKSQMIKPPGSIPYSIIIIDIDNLKDLNDKQGHLQGDKAIKIVGSAIKEGIRDNDIAIHYGGDEYLIILPDTKEEGARKVIRRIRTEIALKSENENIRVEISAGIASSDSICDFEKMAQIADKNMYCEKEQKRL